jgi:hypothetical protein
MRCSRLLGVSPAKAQPQSMTQQVPATQEGCIPDGDFSNCSYTVSPRVKCGGYNGHVWWTDDLEGTTIIGTYGEVWDLCGATTYVYLKWEQNAGLRSGNDNAGHASDFATVGVDYYDGNPTLSIGGVSDVQVTVCRTYSNGWHCGVPDHV